MRTEDAGICGSFGCMTSGQIPFPGAAGRLRFAFFLRSKYNCVGGFYGHNSSQQGTL